MIDYDKLEIAHELAEKLPFSEWAITHMHGTVKNFYVLVFEDRELKLNEEQYTNIDNLIARLKELTKSKPKYSAGQHVWIVMNNESFMVTIDSITGKKYYLKENIGLGAISEPDLFLTKEELIEDQIQYWCEKLAEECDTVLAKDRHDD